MGEGFYDIKYFTPTSVECVVKGNHDNISWTRTKSSIKRGRIPNSLLLNSAEWTKELLEQVKLYPSFKRIYQTFKEIIYFLASDDRIGNLIEK